MLKLRTSPILITRLRMLALRAKLVVVFTEARAEGREV